MAHLNIGNSDRGRYSISFDSSDGTITCEVSALSDPSPKGFSAEDERQAAMKRAKRLARAFCEALPNS
jgi:hypothetical protein